MDQYGYLAAECMFDLKTNLFYANGTKLNKTLSTSVNPQFGSFDSKGRFIHLLNTQINIYY